jgi:hypothetical protein
MNCKNLSMLQVKLDATLRVMFSDLFSTCKGPTNSLVAELRSSRGSDITKFVLSIEHDVTLTRRASANGR